jgi:hypothetical protein
MAKWNDYFLYLDGIFACKSFLFLISEDEERPPKLVKGQTSNGSHFEEPLSFAKKLETFILEVYGLFPKTHWIPQVKDATNLTNFLPNRLE